jgi:uncharacterized membrane protein YccC
VQTNDFWGRYGLLIQLSTKAKEAIKTGLAFTLVYGIALKSGWMDSYRAGFAVAMISLPTAGQSIHKGILRLAGTIQGCGAALVIFGLAPQSRWEFMLLASAWIFFTTYMMVSSKNNAYFWNVAAFVCLIITLAGMIAVLTMISVQNQQTYNFAAMANSYLYTLLAIAFVFAMSCH